MKTRSYTAWIFCIGS